MFYYHDWIKRNQKEYFIASYNQPRYLNLPNSIKGYLCKTEIYEAQQKSTLCGGTSGKKTFVPIINRNNYAELYIEDESGQKHNIKMDRTQEYECFVLEGKYKITSDQDIVFGKPITLEKDVKKKDLVITLFIDGLSYSYLEQEGIEEVMPFTARYFKDGFACHNVYATAEWTLPSVAAICTGLYTTNHNVYHPERRVGLPEDKKTLFEVIQDAGYVTAKIDGDWRVTPKYGYVRGVDRTIYQPSTVYMDAKDVIDEAVKHLEVFKETNQYLWLGFMDLHKVAEGAKGNIIQQSNMPLQYKASKVEEVEKSVKLSYDVNKIAQYKEAIKHVDRYLNFLYQYLEMEYKDKNIIITLISDHGQSYLSKTPNKTLVETRTKVPLMVKGYKTGQSNELIGLTDYFKIMQSLVGITTDECEARDSNLPVCFEGEKEREYIYTEKLYPGQEYEVCINSKTHIVSFKTQKEVLHDGRVSLKEGIIEMIDRETGNLIDDDIKQKEYLSIIEEHMKSHRIYD